MNASRPNPLKLGLSLLALAGSLAVLWNGIASTFETAGAARADDGLEWDLQDDDAEDAPGDGRSNPAPRSGADPSGPSSPGGEAGLAVRPEPAAPSAGRPDWSSLFERLVEREQTLNEVAGGSSPPAADAAAPALTTPRVAPVAAPGAPAEPPADPRAQLSGVTLTGLVRRADGSALALLDGRLLRPGDELPGTVWRVQRIDGDRVVLRRDDAGVAGDDATLWLPAPGHAAND